MGRGLCSANGARLWEPLCSAAQPGRHNTVVSALLLDALTLPRVCSSCEMIFGQAPPPIEEDKVYMQPCFTTQVGMPVLG